MADGRSREQMEEIIDAGGSIIYEGQVITSKDELPDAETIAGGPARRASEQARTLVTAVAGLEAQIADLTRQLDEAKAKLGEQEAAAAGTGSSEPNSGGDGDDTGVPWKTVAEAEEYIASVTDAAELDTLEAAEAEGKGRAGVQAAIDKRRAELTAGE